MDPNKFYCNISIFSPRFIPNDRKIHFGFIYVILLHSCHQTFRPFVWPSSRWYYYFHHPKDGRMKLVGDHYEIKLHH